jgi:hypothetical protein
VRFSRKNQPLKSLNLAKIGIYGDTLAPECFKDMSRYLRQKTVATQLVACHSSTASVCGSFASHSSAFSALSYREDQDRVLPCTSSNSVQLLEFGRGDDSVVLIHLILYKIGWE